MDTTIRATDEVAYRDVSLRDLAPEWYPAGTEQLSEEVPAAVRRCPVLQRKRRW